MHAHLLSHRVETPIPGRSPADPRRGPCPSQADPRRGPCRSPADPRPIPIQYFMEPAPGDRPGIGRGWDGSKLGDGPGMGMGRDGAATGMGRGWACTGTFIRTTSIWCNHKAYFIILYKHISNQQFYKKNWGFLVISQSILGRFRKFKDQNIDIFESNATV